MKRCARHWSFPGATDKPKGQVTRLKFIKRQMYGRANFDLLRQRVAPGSLTTLNAGESPKRVSSIG